MGEGCAESAPAAHWQHSAIDSSHTDGGGERGCMAQEQEAHAKEKKEDKEKTGASHCTEETNVIRCCAYMAWS